MLLVFVFGGVGAASGDVGGDVEVPESRTGFKWFFGLLFAVLCLL